MLTIRGIDHVVLRVRDIERMRKFYCEVLGASHVAYRPEFGMSHLRVGAAMIDLVEVGGPLGKAGGAAPGKEGRNMDHLCLRVEPFDQDAIVSHLKKHGVTVGDIKNRFGAEGNGVSIYLTDPEGNTVELKGPSDGKPPPMMKKRITDAFHRESDGSWTCIEAASFDHPSGRMQFTPGQVFGPEDVFMGVKVAKWLDSLVDARHP